MELDRVGKAHKIGKTEGKKSKSLLVQAQARVVLEPLKILLAGGVEGERAVDDFYREFRGPAEPFVDLGMTVGEGEAPGAVMVGCWDVPPLVDVREQGIDEVTVVDG